MSLVDETFLPPMTQTYQQSALRIVANYHATDGMTPESIEIEVGQPDQFAAADIPAICELVNALAGVPRARYQPTRINNSYSGERENGGL